MLHSSLNRTKERHAPPIVSRAGRVEEKVRAEVDRRLKAAKHPVASKIAAEMTAAGLKVGTTFVRERAIYWHIKLEPYRGGRPVGSKDRADRTRKPRENTLYSRHRDEVLRLLVLGTTKVEIADLLGISRQQVHKLAAALPPEEISKLRAALSDGANRKCSVT